MPTNSHPILLALIVLVAGTAALAAHAPGHIENPLGAGATIMTVIQRILDFAVKILTPLAVLMVLFTGFLYMTAGGNPEKVKAAHRALTWTVIGIAVVLLSKAAEQVIRTALGA